MPYRTTPEGRLKMYWINSENPVGIFDHGVDGLDGVRKWLLDVIPDDDSILDIGCGLGHVSEIFRIADRRNKYLGIDTNDNTINFAKKMFPHAKFDVQDGHFLPYADNSIDHCILFTVIEMIADFRKIVEEAVRVAKKQVIITIWKPLIDGPDKNSHEVNSFGEYVVNINSDKFLKHISSFGHKIKSGELICDGKIEYWWWIIDKDELDK